MPKIFALLLMSTLALAASPQQRSDRFARFSGFELGHTTLSDVQSLLGASEVHEAGDGGDYEAWVCYSLPRGQVEFNSGEMGGGTDVIGFTVSLDGRNKTCPAWPQTVATPELQIGGIRLGISTLTFQSMLDTPIEWRGNVASARYEFQRLPTNEEVLSLPDEMRAQAEQTPGSVKLDVDITVEGTFDNGRLVKLTTWKIETY